MGQHGPGKDLSPGDTVRVQVREEGAQGGCDVCTPHQGKDRT